VTTVVDEGAAETLAIPDLSILKALLDNNTLKSVM